MRRTIVLIAAVAAVGGLLAGCSGNEEFPTGAFVSTADVNNLGPVTATFGEDGALTIEQGALVADGTYTVDGDQVILSDTYCAQEEGDETATYTWNWDGSKLTMTTTDDGCASRQATVAEMTSVE